MKKNNNTQMHTQLIMYAGTLFLTIASIIAVIMAVMMISGNRSHYDNTITVSGRGEVSGEPNIATFSFTVEETAKETETAQEVISKKVSLILDGLAGLGIDEADIKTESYSIYPRYEWATVKNPGEEISVDGEIYTTNNRGKNVLVGYNVSQNVTVKVRDFDATDDVLKLFTQHQVENLYGPQFAIDEPEMLQDEARAMAIADAKEKAKTLAKNLDVKLGKVISFYEGGDEYYDAPVAKMMSADSMALSEESYNPRLPVGENDVVSTVTVVYKIK